MQKTEVRCICSGLCANRALLDRLTICFGFTGFSFPGERVHIVASVKLNKIAR